MTVQLPLTGRCQCGGLRYQVIAPPLMVCACHCSTCQKQTGSAFVLSAMVQEASFSIIEGEPAKTEWISEAGNKRFGWFCGGCGNRIANGQTPSNGILSLRAGTLDDTSWVRPAGHIWVRSAQPWVRFEPDDILNDTQPTDFTPYIERFRGFDLFSQ